MQVFHRSVKLGWPALLVVAAAGFVVAPQAVGLPQETGQAEEQAEEKARQNEISAEQAETLAREAVEAARAALEKSRHALAETVREGMVRGEAAMRLQEEALQRELRLMQERVRAVAPQIARARGFAFFGGGAAERILTNADEIGLTDEQKERVRAADKVARRERIERDALIELAELDLEEMVRELDSIDLVAVENKLLDIAQLRVRARIADLRLRQQLDAVLTQEQRDKLKEMHGNVLMLRGEGARWRVRGPGATLFSPDGDDLVIGLGEVLEPLEWIDEFEFEVPQLWEFRLERDDDQEVEAPRPPEPPPSGVKRRTTGTSGTAAPMSPARPVSFLRTLSY